MLSDDMFGTVVRSARSALHELAPVEARLSTFGTNDTTWRESAPIGTNGTNWYQLKPMAPVGANDTN